MTKIDADDRSITEILSRQRFSIDYFQREYRWKKEHMESLIEDLTNAFLKSYEPLHQRNEVANYQNYYLGPMVFSNKNANKSIIDGQQRITSITLLLIYLFHSLPDDEQNQGTKNSISNLIYSEQYGEKSFNINDKTREPCLKALFEKNKYTPQENENETVKNMAARYTNIYEFFPETIDKNALPYFIDWLQNKIIVVEIIADSDENAYTIFETMNDRGLSLTPTEMLKGYILSKIIDAKRKQEIDDLWKTKIQELNRNNKSADKDFFQVWFRSKYAETIRAGEKGARDEDFELIGSRFHNWFKDNEEEIFNLKTSDDFYQFFKIQFPFYVKWYLTIKETNFNSKIPHLYYIQYWGIAPALQDSLLLSSINYEDNENIIRKKLDFVARFIETFTVRRATNYRNFASSSIKHTIFERIQLIRNNNLDALKENLIEEINKISQDWEGVLNLRRHGQNGKFIKHLLSRISSYIDILAKQNSNYSDYHHPKEGRPFEIEHLWNDKFEEYREEFEQRSDFDIWRNYIGALILLPEGTNQSYGKKRYEKKLEHYFRENTYAKTLHPKFYENNPNFLNSKEIQELGFKPHQNFKKQDIEERKELVKRICEQLWSTDYFK